MFSMTAMSNNSFVLLLAQSSLRSKQSLNRLMKLRFEAMKS